MRRYATYNDHSTVSAHFALGESAVELYNKQQQQNGAVPDIKNQHNNLPQAQNLHSHDLSTLAPLTPQSTISEPEPNDSILLANHLPINPIPSYQSHQLAGEIGQSIELAKQPLSATASPAQNSQENEANSDISKLVESTQNLVTNQDVLDINQFVIKKHSGSTEPSLLLTNDVIPIRSTNIHHFQSPIVVNEFYPHYNLTELPSAPVELHNELSTAHQPKAIDFLQIINGKYAKVEDAPQAMTPKPIKIENCSEQPEFGDRLLPTTLPEHASLASPNPKGTETVTEQITSSQLPTDDGSLTVTMATTLDVYKPVEIEINTLLNKEPSNKLEEKVVGSHPIITTAYVENILDTLQQTHDKIPPQIRTEPTKLHLIHPYIKPYFLYENDHDTPRLLAKTHFFQQPSPHLSPAMIYPIHFHPRVAPAIPSSYYRHHHILPKPVYGVPVSSSNPYFVSTSLQTASPKSYHNHHNHHNHLQHQHLSIYPDDYVGPPPLFHRHYWPSATSYSSSFSDRSSAANNDCEPSTIPAKLSRKASKNLLKHIRLEYGFKPPLIPSLEIDEHGNTISGQT